MIEVNKGEYSKLSRALMLYILFFSSVITFISTSIILYFEYTQEVSRINSSITQIEKSYIKSLSNSLWQFDYGQLNNLLQGISDIPDITYVEVSTPKEKILSIGKKLTSSVITKKFKLSIKKNDKNNKRTHLGEFVLVASLDRVYQRLKYRVFVIFATQAIKTFLVSLFIYLLVIRLITNRLWKITKFLSDDNFIGHSSMMPIDVKRGRGEARDELDLVAKAIFENRKKLLKANENLKIKEDNLRQLSRKLISSQEEERSRISRDLHDDIGQKLAILKLVFSSKFKNKVTSLDDFHENRNLVFTHIDELVAGVRNVAKRLSPSILFSFGLMDAIKWLLKESFKDTEIDYHEEFSDDLKIDNIDLSLTIFRVIQESVGNIMKHSGARLVKFSFLVEDNSIKIEISDDGKGLLQNDLTKMGTTGIVGMKERLRLYNGVYSINNCKELGGVKTSVLIPLENIG